MDYADTIASGFLEEAAERLAELETALLALECDPDNAELVAGAFRAMHTIKGSGAMFGFDLVAEFTHELETVFDEVRSGRLAVSAPLIDLALAAKDLIRRLLAGEGQETSVERERLVQALRAFLPSLRPGPKDGSGRGKRTGSGATAPNETEGSPEQTFRVVFRPKIDLFRNGTNPAGLFRELAALGTSVVVAYPSQVPDLEELDAEACYLRWDIIVSTSRGMDAIRDVFIFVEDHAEIRIEVLDDGRSSPSDSEYKRLGEILVERGELATDCLKEILGSQKRVGDLLVERGVVSPEAVEAAAIEQRVVRQVRARREAASQPDSASSVRVAADKLDQLIDLVGELVIAQARLGRLAYLHDDPELLSVAENMDRLAADLRDSTLKIRMVPIGTTFGKFKRLVRDLSAELGKQIELVTEGAETELDKTVIERLGDPLVHLIRNSCDHGIEDPEARRAAGKPAQGLVRLRAYHTGPNVFIEIQDDGGGLDLAAIRQRAVERELIAADSRMSEAETYRLIFLPGFSTATTVSNLSGRGVGMDVVKRSVDGLRGTVEVESAQGVGTTIRLCLPLTLAIIEGLLVSVGQAHYVLPMSLVEECVELTVVDAKKTRGNCVVAVRGELVPYLRLRDWFAAEGEQPEIEQVVIASADGFRFGFVVDDVLGQHQTVIKNLGRCYRNVQGLSGATILGDGTVALIVDVPALIRSSRGASDLPN